MAEVRRIMQVCTCLWGGAFNPIIPVCDDLPEQWTQQPFHTPTGLEFAKGYLDSFEPDVFVESESGLAARAGIGELKLTYLEPRVVSLNVFFEPGRGGEPKIPFGLTVLDLYQEPYDRQFQFVRRHDRRVAVFESSADHAPLCRSGFRRISDRRLSCTLGASIS